MEDSPSRRSFSFKILFIILFILAVALLLAGGMYFLTVGKPEAQKQEEKSSVESERKELVAKVGKLYDLPDNEIPQIATVTDVEKLKDKELFRRAKNGDKVLIYEKAKKAILYRPSIDKVIDVAPVNFVPPTDAPKEASSSAKKTEKQAVVKVSLLNGTKAKALTTRMETELSDYEDVTTEVVSKGNAAGDYEKTIVIDISGKNAAVAKKLATFTKGSVAKLPKVENQPEADILIILGNDYANR